MEVSIKEFEKDLGHEVGAFFYLRYRKQKKTLEEWWALYADYYGFRNEVSAKEP
jgi:hypothetical protein